MKQFAGLALLIAAAVVPVPAAHAALITFGAALNGANENPPVATTGTGYASVTYDDSAHTLLIDVSFTGLTGTTTVAHIHCCVAAPGTVGVAVTPATLPGFPAGVTSGVYDPVLPLDLTMDAVYTAGFLTGSGGTAGTAEAALVAGLLAGQAYLNIHTSFAPGGEIRGFLQQIPEPGMLALLGLGLAGVAVARRLTRPRDCRRTVSAAGRFQAAWAAIASRSRRERKSASSPRLSPN